MRIQEEGWREGGGRREKEQHRRRHGKVADTLLCPGHLLCLWAAVVRLVHSGCVETLVYGVKAYLWLHVGSGHGSTLSSKDIMYTAVSIYTCALVCVCAALQLRHQVQVGGGICGTGLSFFISLLLLLP